MDLAEVFRSAASLGQGVLGGEPQVVCPVVDV